jgi:DNA primase
MLDRIGDKNRLAAEGLAKLLPRGPVATASRIAAPAGLSGSASPVRRAIQLLLQDPHLAAKIEARDREFLAGLERPGAGLLYQLLILLHERPEIKFGSIIEHFRGSEHQQHIVKLGGSAIPGEPEELQALFQGSLRKLRLEATGQEIERLMNKERFVGLSTTEKSELKRLLAEKSSV